MKSKNLSLGWIPHFLLICLFVQISKAEIALFSIDSHREPAAVRVYSIDEDALTNPVTISAETIGLGPVGIAASEDLGLDLGISSCYNKVILLLEKMSGIIGTFESERGKS